jgi:hypothetical protein
MSAPLVVSQLYYIPIATPSALVRPAHGQRCRQRAHAALAGAMPRERRHQRPVPACGCTERCGPTDWAHDSGQAAGTIGLPTAAARAHAAGGIAAGKAHTRCSQPSALRSPAPRRPRRPPRGDSLAFPDLVYHLRIVGRGGALLCPGSRGRAGRMAAPSWVPRWVEPASPQAPLSGHHVSSKAARLRARGGAARGAPEPKLKRHHPD